LIDNTNEETFELGDNLGDIDLDWANPPSLRDLKHDFEEALPFQQSQMQKVTEYLENLHVTGAAKPKRKGKSNVVPQLIRKQAEWRYPALSEPFLSTTKLYNAMGKTHEDTDAAEQNALVLNHQFNVDINKNHFIDTYVRSAVNTGTVIVKLGWENEEEEITELVDEYTYDFDYSFVETIQEALALKESNINGYYEQVPEFLQVAIDKYSTTGIPFKPVATGNKIEQTRIVVRKNAPTVEVCDQANVYIDPTCLDDVDNAGFVIYSFLSDMSTLQKDDRYFNLKYLRPDDESALSDPEFNADMQISNFRYKDKARKKMVVYEYSGFWDIQGDGVLVPIIAAWVGDVLIRLEVSPYPDKKVPFVTVPYLPVEDSIYGEPDGALLVDNQKIAAALMRGIIDTLGRTASGQMGYAQNWLDPTNKLKRERGEDYQFRQGADPRTHVHTETYPEIAQSAYDMINMQNIDAESLTGVKAFTGGLSGDALGKTATGARGVLDSAAKREGAILRRLATGMEKIGKKISAYNGVFLSEEQVVRITNDQYKVVRRDELAGEFDVVLTISTPE